MYMMIRLLKMNCAMRSVVLLTKLLVTTNECDTITPIEIKELLHECKIYEHIIYGGQ